MASLSHQVAAARGVLQRHLAATGVSLDQSLIEYRPAEPAPLQHVPRAVFRLSLADPGSGWVVVYDLGQPDRAFAAGRELASYLGSGFGQTNFPPDARFHVNQLDGALIFAWWSPALTTDRDRAEAAFAVLPLVGQSIPVVR